MTAAVAFQPQELFWPDNFLPSQVDHGRLLSGPHALLHAVVENAINCIRSVHTVPSARKYRLAKEALDWILSEEDHLFSFLFCCQHLGVSPYRVRKGAKGEFAKLMPPGRHEQVRGEVKLIPFVIFNKDLAASKLPAWLSRLQIRQPGKHGSVRVFNLKEYSYTRKEAERIAREYIKSGTWQLQK